MARPDWSRESSLFRGLAKAWFMVFVARRNNQLAKADKLRSYTRRTTFDAQWLDSVPGLRDLTMPADDPHGARFSPSHNEIVTKIVNHILAKPIPGESPARINPCRRPS